MTFQLIAAFLQSLVQLGTTLEGQGKFGGEAAVILAALNAGRALIQQGNAASEDLRSLCAEIEAMAAEGRQPTVDEFDALRARLNAAVAAADVYLAEHGESQDESGN
jgi:ElaB/YqjD/DUF883 family membrane-anchored ribosome-binding protein